MSLSVLCICLILIACLSCSRLYATLPQSTLRLRIGSAQRRGASDTCSLAVFLGSGGHTSEALALISTLDFSRYAPRKYLISEGDTLSAQKAKELEVKAANQQNLKALAASYELFVVPRARRVHQPLITTLPTAIRSLLWILKCMIRHSIASKGPFSDVLLFNGPGTCFVLCVAVYVLKFFGFPTPKTIYVESFARVNSLSLSGKLLRPFVDRFVVQWPQLLTDGGRGECRGWLV